MLTEIVDILIDNLTVNISKPAVAKKIDDAASPALYGIMTPLQSCNNYEKYKGIFRGIYRIGK